MRLTVYTSDGGTLDFENFDAETALDFREELERGTSRVLTFDMDGATVLVNRDHLVRADFDHDAEEATDAPE